MSDKTKKTVVIALGYFDSVHIGHRAVIGKARRLAAERGCEAAVFTFGGNLRAALHGGEEKAVYTVSERRNCLKGLSISEIYFAPVSRAFLNKSPERFLEFLNGLYDIKGYVCGRDYRFGKGGAGDREYLEKYALAHGQKLVIEDDFIYGGEKVSTTRIKGLLKDGKIEEAGKLLGGSYFVTGKVFEDRKVGRKLGFPTVNIRTDPDKFRIKDGVYAGHVIIKGKYYKTVTNYGARPTFDLSAKLIEAHIIGFSGGLYGKNLTLYFDFYIRDIQKFNSPVQLAERLKKDVEMANGKDKDI